MKKFVSLTFFSRNIQNISDIIDNLIGDEKKNLYLRFEFIKFTFQNFKNENLSFVNEIRRNTRKIGLGISLKI